MSRKWIPLLVQALLGGTEHEFEVSFDDGGTIFLRVDVDKDFLSRSSCLFGQSTQLTHAVDGTQGGRTASCGYNSAQDVVIRSSGSFFFFIVIITEVFFKRTYEDLADARSVRLHFFNPLMVSVCDNLD